MDISNRSFKFIIIRRGRKFTSICSFMYYSALYYSEQFVFANGIKSRLQLLSCGVPQGSVLGSLLFITYINDLHLQCKNSTAYLFADDTSLMFHSNNQDGDMIKAELCNIKEWMTSNKLVLNDDKSVFVSLNRRSCDKPFSEDPFFNNTIHQSCKYLGIYLDKCLTFKNHVNYLLPKISQKIGLLKKLSRVANIECRLVFYNAFIKPLIQYGILVYGSSSLGTLFPIFEKQKKLLTIIFGVQRSHPSAELFIRGRVLSVYNLYVYELFKFVTKSKHGLLACNTLNNIYENNLPHEYNTRARTMNLTRTPFPKSNLSLFSVKYRGHLLLNALKCHTIFSSFASEMNSNQQSFATLVHKFRDKVLLKDNSFAELLFPERF